MNVTMVSKHKNKLIDKPTELLLLSPFSDDTPSLLPTLESQAPNKKFLRIISEN